jgi:virginiamycin B lyase
MPTLIIHAIDCKVVSSGTDAGLVQAAIDTIKGIADVGAASAPFLGPEGAAIGKALEAGKGLLQTIPGLISAIDKTLNSPDQLYLNLSNDERQAKIWPSGNYENINGGQIARPNLRVPFNDAIDVNFWEYDTGSDDDFLGRLTVDKSHAGGIRYQIVAMPSEGNVYVVVYSVDLSPAWKQIGGALTRISAGSRSNVWGVNSAGNIYRYTQDDARPWIQIPGGLSDIGAAADGTVWGVNSAGNIYRYLPNGTWKQIGGALTRISVGSSSNVWGVNSAGNIYRYTQDDARPWIQIPGGLSDIGVAADGTVWGVNSADNIFRYLPDGTWKHIGGKLKAISAGSSSNVCGVNSAGNIYRYTQNDSQPWIQIPGGLSDIGAGIDGTIWGVNSVGNIYRLENHS